MSRNKLAELADKLADGRVLFRESFEASVLENGARTGSMGVRLVEGEGGDGADAKNRGTITGVAAKADIINKNRRLYSKKVYELAVGRAQALIGQGIFLGEVDHPWYGTLQGAAARFTKVWMDGDLMRFEAVILKTEQGEHLRALLDGGVGVQVSTRGYASSTTEQRDLDGVPVDIAIIGEDYTMEGIDFVLFASNPAGRVQTESQLQPEVNPVTLEKLMAEHADLVAQIQTAAREGYVPSAEVESKVAEAVATARTEGHEAGKKEALESADVAGRATAIASVLEALKPYLPVAEAAKEEVEQTEAERTIAALKSTVEGLTATVTTLTAERTAAQEAEAKAALTLAVSAKVDAVLEGFAHAELVKADLLKCESVEAVETLFTERKALIEQTLARAAVTEGNKGKGEAEDGEKPTTEQLTEAEKVELEEVNRTRRIADLPPLKALPKKQSA